MNFFPSRSDPDECSLVAVYGTLKRGHSNHSLLLDSRFVGEDISTGFVLYDLGEYPGARFGVSDGLYIEVYEVDRTTLAALDALEECDPEQPHRGLYSRVSCMTSYGIAWIYVYNHEADEARRISSGRWPPVHPG